MVHFPKIAKLATADQFRGHLADLNIPLPFEDHLESAGGPLASRLQLPPDLGWPDLGNRFCILPMEGWDGQADGAPSELTRRRWVNFGLSGAKLIWGGEAVAVCREGRANPSQLLIQSGTVSRLSALREALVEAHENRFGSSDDLSVGLQLTHSGRFARPNHKTRMEPRTVYRHPLLDRKFGIEPAKALLSDDELRQVMDQFVAAAELAEQAGFAWVDIKHCHGYLGHELLTAHDRPGPFGGDLENRTRFLREIVNGIRETTRLKIGVRLSVFDFIPHAPGADGVGRPVPWPEDQPYRYAFGGNPNVTALATETEPAIQAGINLAETESLLRLLQQMGISLLCTTAGSPYWVPHIQRPAAFPPSDGYLPPEDPLVGVARQIQATAALKQKFPEMVIVGSGYSYLQQWLPHVAQAVIRQGGADCVGLGRMVLSYPDLPADVLNSNPLQRKKICRTFSDCTTAPRKGLVSGCYPLDDFYKKREEFKQLQQLKKG